MITKLISLIALLCFIAELPAQMSVQSRRESTTEFDGFELPDVADWVGESETVNYEPPPEASDSWRAIEFWMTEGGGGDAGIFYMGIVDDDWMATPPPPIELVSFQQHVASDTKATVSESGDASSAQARRSDSSTNEFPVYANVVNESGSLLASSRAYSQQDGWAGETTVQAQGRVGSYADIRSSLSSEDSSAEATSSSSLTAKYQLTEEFDFILDATLSAEWVDEGFSFRLRDVSLDADLIDFEPIEGQSRRLELCGTLAPGTYELIVDTESFASTHTSGDPDFGGLAEFDFYFRAFDPDGISDLTILDPASFDVETGVWRPAEIWTYGDADTFITSPSAIPEPTAFRLLIFGLPMLCVLRRKRLVY